jgi:hypothetical protein
MPSWAPLDALVGELSAQVPKLSAAWAYSAAVHRTPICVTSRAGCVHYAKELNACMNSRQSLSYD